MRAVPLLVVALAIVAVVVMLPNHPGGRIPSEDAGVFFYTAQRWLEGTPPYLSVWDHKPPLVYALDAIGLAVAGRLGVWLVQVATLVAAALAGFAAMSRAFGRRAALVGSFAWLVAVPRLAFEDGRQTSFVEFYALPLQFGALLLFSSATLTARRAVLIGVLGGAAFLLKPTLVGVWVAVAAYALWSGRAAARDAVRAPLQIAAGAALSTAVAATLIAPALGEAIDQALRYNLVYATFSPLGERIGAVPEGIRLLLPSGLAALAIGAWVYALRTPGRPPLLAVALIALPLELALATSGRGYHYYFLAWLPAMGVLAAFAARELLARLPERGVRLAVAVALVLMSVQPVRLAMRLASSVDEGSAGAAAAYLADRSARTDLVLIWGSHVEAQLLAERRAPTRYIYQYAALATRGYATPARFDELLADLERGPPLLIVDASADSFVTPPLDRAVASAWRSPEPQYEWRLADVERVIAFVEARYARDGSIPGAGWPVWRLR